MKTTVTKITCDRCKADIPTGPYASFEVNSENKFDLCKPCLSKVRTDFELDYQRVFHGLVPDRRGGFRRLGDPADT